MVRSRDPQTLYCNALLCFALGHPSRGDRMARFEYGNAFRDVFLNIVG
jgi:hypothetical protein